jgi:glycerol-3-phosphate cytidylyltransferase
MKQSKQYKIGFTASCFDLLHAGHIAMLQEAKSICDHLIVGMQTDPTIDRLEKSKPIQSILERQIQINAVKYVDQVIVYETEAQLVELLNSLAIDVRIIGEEYRGKSFTGLDIKNIDIYYNKRQHEWSSSGLRKLILEKSENK